MKQPPIQVGDLVETCAMEPGFVVSVDYYNNDVDVQNPFRDVPSNHSLIHCGVHTISPRYAFILWKLGEKILEENFLKLLKEHPDGVYWNEDFVTKLYEQKFGKMDLPEDGFRVRLSGSDECKILAVPAVKPDEAVERARSLWEPRNLERADVFKFSDKNLRKRIYSLVIDG